MGPPLSSIIFSVKFWNIVCMQVKVSSDRQYNFRQSMKVRDIEGQLLHLVRELTHNDEKMELPTPPLDEISNGVFITLLGEIMKQPAH